MDSFREVLGWYEQCEHASVVSLNAIKAYEEKHGTGLTIMLLYFLGGTELAEHGGSVYGSWLTKLGAAVKKFVEENEEWTP